MPQVRSDLGIHGGFDSDVRRALHAAETTPKRPARRRRADDDDSEGYDSEDELYEAQRLSHTASPPGHIACSVRCATH